MNTFSKQEHIYNVPEVDFFLSFSVFQDIDILASTPPMDLKLAPKCLFSGVLQYDIEFYLRGGVQKNLKIKNYPPCFEKVFIRKISFRGLQWYIFSLVYPLWCWSNKPLKIFWLGSPLHCHIHKMLFCGKPRTATTSLERRKCAHEYERVMPIYYIYFQQHLIDSWILNVGPGFQQVTLKHQENVQQQTLSNRVILIRSL